VGKVKILIIVALVAVFSFVPMINMSYETVVQKQVSEEYTTVEPYVVQEEVTEPYFVDYDHVIWGESGYPTVEHRTATLYRRVTKDITHYREVTKTRLVYRPIVETRTKRVSLLRYLLR
jgi:hypothetical protein